MAAVNVLEAGRNAAEALMLDTCRVTRTGSAEDRVWDDVTGTWTTPARVTVYEGRCKVQVANLQPRDAEAGEVTVAVTSYALHVPISGTGDVGRGMEAVVLSAAFDEALVGLRLHVEALHVGSQKTARRFACEVVS